MHPSTIPSRALLSCFLLASGCFAHPAAIEDDCFTPFEAGASPNPTNGRQLQGKTNQGMQLQGKTDQGTSFNGTEQQARDRQGATLRADPCGAAGSGCQTLLGGLNGAHLVQGSTDVVLQAGKLVNDLGLPIDGMLQALAPDGSSWTFEVLAASDDSASYELRAEGQPICADGGAGVFVAGSWSSTGDHISDSQAVTFACPDGVIAKCVRWGYAPWKVGAELHQACTRMARADYCGDGKSWTREGTLINLYDTENIQLSEPTAGLSFEAAWGPDGAICVDQPRYLVTHDDGSLLSPPCWEQLPQCDSNSWRTHSSALLANESAHTVLAACTP